MRDRPFLVGTNNADAQFQRCVKFGALLYTCAERAGVQQKVPIPMRIDGTKEPHLWKPRAAIRGGGHWDGASPIGLGRRESLQVFCSIL